MTRDDDEAAAELAYALTLEQDGIPVAHVLVSALDTLARGTARRGSAHAQLLQAPPDRQRAVLARLIDWAY